MHNARPIEGVPLFGGAWAIFKRELRQYFVSPIAYFVAFAMLLLTGLVFNADLNTWVINRTPAGAASTPNFLVFLMVFMAPLLTMRLLAEENREGTIELLMTMPVRDTDIILGKFFGVWVYYTLVLAATLVYQLILASIAEPDMGTAVAAYLGVWLYGGAALAVGLLFSATTENQVIAGFLTLSVLVIFFWSNTFAQSIQSPALQELVRTLSLSTHYYRSFANGILRLEDLLFYLFVIAGALFTAVRLIESRRWR